MRDIQREIQENLDAIEREHGVRVLLAVESGSRAWGFASPDSDYDVRFIYVRPEEDYLRLWPKADVIEWALDDVLDINGWDLRKALPAMRKGNPVLYEWMRSPIVYRKDAHWEAVEGTLADAYTEKPALYHYYGLANKTARLHLSGNLVSYKKYFYALRPLLCCRWIEKYHEIPPVEFSRLLDLFSGKEAGLTEDLHAEILRLLEEKALTGEKELKPGIQTVSRFIEEDCIQQKLYIDALGNTETKDTEYFEKVFLELVRD